MQPEWKDDGSKQARATMDKVGREILDKSKGNLQTSGEKVEKSARLKGRDILTLLLRANTATDIREHQRMSDEEVKTLMGEILESYQNDPNFSAPLLERIRQFLSELSILWNS